MYPEAVISRRDYGSLLKHYPHAFYSRRCRHRLVQQGLSLSWVFEVRVGSYEWFDGHAI
jgi:hypothetical protein